LDEFEALGKFIEAFPETIRNEELEQPRQHLLNFAKNYDGSWADSPDDYRYFADRLGCVGGMLDVDVSEYCEDLERQASEWEAELPSEGDSEDFDDEERWDRPESTSDDTSTMFEELLDELNERDP
jgi:hypothetical protein